MWRIGVDLGGTKIEALALAGGEAVVRTGGEETRIRIPAPRDDYVATLQAIAGLVRQLEEIIGATAPVGIGTPGAISPATGRIKNSNSVWLNGRPLKQDLERELHREIRLANDADCFTLSEATDGAAAGARVVFGVILGTGVGGGIVVDGRLITGPNAIGGEWGHNPLPRPADDERPGRDCYCGQKGCIETFLSGPGLTADYQKETGTALTPAAILRQAEAGERVAEKVLHGYEDRLARSLATVINLLDPDVIVLGGGLSNLDRLYTGVPRRWPSYVFSDRVDTRLVSPLHGDSSGVRGAARLWEA
jgi:fructokinase